MESLRSIPKGWTQGDPPAQTDMLVLRLAMDQPMLADFHQLVNDLSIPDHPLYGKHLTKREVDDILQPSSDVSDEILTWLKNAGVAADLIKLSGHWITFHLNVSTAEALLVTKFYNFHKGDVTVIRTLQYSVPSILRNKIETIQPTTRFGNPKAQVEWLMDNSNESPPLQIDPSVLRTYNVTFCNSTITPACIRGIYQMDTFDPPVNAMSIAISGFIEQRPFTADVTEFMAYTDPTVSGRIETVSVDKGVISSQVNTNAEANLDVQYAAALTGGTPLVYFSTGGRAPMNTNADQPSAANGTNEPYLDQLHFLLGLNDSLLPSVLSTSYAEDEETVPYSYAVQVCNLFAQLGARGVSVIFASGDTGVGSSCQSNDGKNTLRFSPSFPASCPWVTAVGGTYSLNPEIAAAFTSGGFSNYFPQPTWQTDTMKDYFNKLRDKNKGYYNISGRGYPDVSAQAVRYLIWNQGGPEYVYGTSCAAPTFAAIISNLNNIRMTQGKTKLGFLNPWLYAQGHQGFTDITVGASRGCSGVDIFTGQPAGVIKDASWEAISGWDPVTGWGTPNYAKLKTMVAKS
ncbi:Tripeptidyl-peptidase sed2 [Exophiala xenobiotica]